MKTPKWQSLKTFDAWKVTLNAILAEAKTASDANDEETLFSLCDLLLEFITRSDPAITGTDDLDQIAHDAHQSIAENMVSDAVDAIRARTGSIVALTKEIEHVAGEVEATAQTLRLEKVRATVDALTAAARTLKDLDTVWQDGTDAELRARLADLAKEVDRVQSLLKKQES